MTPSDASWWGLDLPIGKYSMRIGLSTKTYLWILWLQNMDNVWRTEAVTKKECGVDFHISFDINICLTGARISAECE